jgi:CheY-like chemotaxis protein
MSTDAMRRFTVLFVEDDFEARDTVAAILRGHGFGVLVASDGYSALRLLFEHRVDLMFADVRLPGLSGFELAEKAKVLRPGLRILYTSGWDERPEDRARQRYGKVLRKPLRADEFVMEIRRALGQ